MSAGVPLHSSCAFRGLRATFRQVKEQVMNKRATVKLGQVPWICASLLVVLPLVSAAAQTYEGFTEPYRTINVAAAETGIVAELLVREGDHVQAGQPLAKLDCEVQEALLAIAEQNMLAEGRLDAAVAELHLRQERFGKLKSLRIEGHARQEEVDRARAEVEVAKAHVRAAQEDLLNRKLEHEKIQVQIARRTVRAPVTGVVTTLHKQIGEFVAPNTPDVLTLVELDPLLASFTVMSGQVTKLRTEQKLTVEFLSSRRKTTGVVELVAPVTDAESGTVQIKLRIANPDHLFRSGERCRILLTD